MRIMISILWLLRHISLSARGRERKVTRIYRKTRMLVSGSGSRVSNGGVCLEKKERERELSVISRHRMGGGRGRG